MLKHIILLSLFCGLAIAEYELSKEDRQKVEGMAKRITNDMIKHNNSTLNEIFSRCIPEKLFYSFYEREMICDDFFIIAMPLNIFYGLQTMFQPKFVLDLNSTKEQRPNAEERFTREKFRTTTHREMDPFNTPEFLEKTCQFIRVVFPEAERIFDAVFAELDRDLKEQNSFLLSNAFASVMTGYINWSVQQSWLAICRKDINTYSHCIPFYAGKIVKENDILSHV